MKTSLLAIYLLLATALTLGAETVVNSKHNLSASGPGTIKATAESEICIFCHTPHNASPAAPLWNRASSGAVYVPYDSPSLTANPGQPTGSSRLCLSCHDGTLALGMVNSRSTPITLAGGVSFLPSGRSNLGTNLSNDHPISFRFDAALAAANGELHDPENLPQALKLDANRELQCTTCHDPHDDQFGKFLVMNNTESALCASCHDKANWLTSSHRLSTATWNGQGPDPWPNHTATTVAGNACQNCHTPHAAGTPHALLEQPTEEQTCLVCHNGNVAGVDVSAEFAKFSNHPITLTEGVHDPTEDLVHGPRHVECVDCHNPHAANTSSANAPNAPGSLAGVAGINLSGAVVDPVQFEYELCFRCHADSTNKGGAHVNRIDPETNTRLEFSANNASYHPVTAVGQNPDVPSLVAGYSVNSQINCSDCHNSNASPSAGSTGANGPHGSIFAPILERQLALTDFNAESANTYALCYKCHDRASILANESFPEHQRHVVIAQGSCVTCHDPHGSASNTHLINFNPDYVTPFNGVLEYTDTGRYSGNCTLTCHGYGHNQVPYPRQ